MFHKLLSYTLIVLLFGCSIHSRKFIKIEHDRISPCRDNWVYKDLESETQLKVLIFENQFRVCLSFYPSMVIGILNSGDTVAVLDKDFKGKINKNDKIKLKSSTWDLNDKENIKAPFFITKKVKENDLFCIVKTVYYAQIDTLSIKH